MIFKQLFDAKTSTYSYLLADPQSREAVLIDPVAEQVERDLQLLAELELQLVFVLDTHVHADHVTGSGLLRAKTGAKTVVGRAAKVSCADIAVACGETLRFGSLEIEARFTPGHTAGCTSYVVHNADHTMVFTGDALLIRGCGRTDFQEGDAHTLYRSVHSQLYSLPNTTLVYPGHDYRGHTRSSIAEEKAHNRRLAEDVTETEFVALMDALKLAKPRLIDVAVPANQACGLDQAETVS